MEASTRGLASTRTNLAATVLAIMSLVSVVGSIAAAQSDADVRDWRTAEQASFASAYDPVAQWRAEERSGYVPARATHDSLDQVWWFRRGEILSYRTPFDAVAQWRIEERAGYRGAPHAEPSAMHAWRRAEIASYGTPRDPVAQWRVEERVSYVLAPVSAEAR